LPAEQEVDALTRAELAFGARGNEVARERMNAGECLSAANDAWRRGLDDRTLALGAAIKVVLYNNHY
jgi:hypothetical protein